MDKTAYMNALRMALNGLPAAVIEETMWAYESKFVDAMVAGKSEEEIAAGLPRPELVAAQKKASTRYDALKRNFTVGNVAGLMVAIIGLMVFNLFMLIPAVAYFSILCATYILAFGMYAAGIGITAASLSGVDEFTFDLPVHHHHKWGQEYHAKLAQGQNSDVHVDITDSGILVDGKQLDEPTHKVESSAASVPASGAGSAASLPVVQAGVSTSSAVETVYGQEKIHVEVGNHFSGTTLASGIGMLLGSILLFMLSMFVTKYTFIGFKHYLRWNLTQLQLVRPA